MEGVDAGAEQADEGTNTGADQGGEPDVISSYTAQDAADEEALAEAAAQEVR